jgi:[acyl-carrier-protein] S-malonyltransferase
LLKKSRKVVNNQLTDRLAEAPHRRYFNRQIRIRDKLGEIGHMSRAFVFPGQGSQAVGMGRELAEAFATARHVFEEVDEALGQRLSRLMFNGPEEQLTLTENAQPALMAVSMAVVRVLEKDGGADLASIAKYVAGHSLGEYSALCAAGTFTLGDTARLLKIRGQAMQKAVPVGVGAMAALLGMEMEQVEEVAKLASQKGEICAVANDNSVGQIVVSGHKGAVEQALKLAAERGGKRSVLLPVSAPFHCSLMQPAALAMDDALSRVTIKAPQMPVVANVTAAPVVDPVSIKKLLVEQVTGMVRWRESVLKLKELGVTNLVEAGSGKVLAGMTKRIDKELSAISLNSPADIESFLKSL